LAKDLPQLCDDTRVHSPPADASAQAAALHALREQATALFDAAMAARRARTQDQLLGAVWHASEDPGFAAALGQRWPLLLIDEFQDTDPRQWALFRRMYAAAPADVRLLCLIGDPKQAIYRFRGGDLNTYLHARNEVVAEAGDAAAGVFELSANYRSRPALLRALDHLFKQHEHPFRNPNIRAATLRAAGAASDEDLRLGDAPAPAITLHWLAQPQPDPQANARSAAGKGMRTSEDERGLMTAAAVAAIAELLAHARLRGDALAPSDIAVLTPRNQDAQAMQAALAAAGLTASVVGGDSVYASAAAQDVDTLLRALAEPGDPGLFRAALATPLLGYDAAAIAALEQNAKALAGAVDGFERAALLWRSRGPLPALLPFATAAARRWLRERGGARRLTDTLHVLELLQADAPLHHGPVEQLRWFAQARAQPGDRDRAQLRLDADEDAIQISTIHKAKGLEYAVVVLPYSAMARATRTTTLRTIETHDASGQALRAWLAKDVLQPPDLETLCARADAEDAAEAQRLLYVALTRAQYAVHLVWSRNDGTDETALHWLLHGGQAIGSKPDQLSAEAMRERLTLLANGSAGGIALRDTPDTIDEAAVARDVARVHARQAAPLRAVAPARSAQRRFGPELRLHSFSALHARGEAAQPSLLATRPGADDEAGPAPEDDAEAALAGTAFGNAVHAVLEATDPAAWRLPADALSARAEHEADFAQIPVDGEPGRKRRAEDRCPPEQRPRVERAMRREGLEAGPAALAQTARLVHRALNLRLPGDVRLCALAPNRWLREMSFHFRLRHARTDALYELLEAHGYPRTQRLPPTRLDGLMHGFVDTIYRDAAGRHYVLDYKTNRLPAYDPASLRAAVSQRDYDLQYLIYLVALRRWLRLRRGAAFAPARDLGGAVYLFLRGIALNEDDMHEPDVQQDDLPANPTPEADANSTRALMTRSGQFLMPFGERPAPAPEAFARAGVHFDPVPPALLAALDALFDGAAGGAP
jgi:exodeoxyribonuclease V beta subunit